MTRPTLEERIRVLELQVAQLRNELNAKGRRKKDWRRAVGLFTDDEGMQENFREAMRLREADRQKARRKATGKRRSKA
jgi:hypothetical protein